MRKIKKASELLWLFGIIFVALGVCICSKADLGVSMIAAPAFIVYEAIAPLWSGFSVGMVEYLVQGVLLIIMCIVVRRFDFRYLLGFGVAVLYGCTLNLFLFLLSDVQVHSVAGRWILLLVGDVCTAFGVACFFHTYMPLQVFELFVTEVTGRFKLNIHKFKWAYDLSLLAVSVALALVLFGDVKTFDWSKIGYTSFHSIGLGTLVTTIINSPIISLMDKLINKVFEDTPRFPKLEKVFKL